MIIRVYLKRNPYCNMIEPDELRWEAYNVEGGFWSMAATRVNAVKDLCNQICKTSRLYKTSCIDDPDYKPYKIEPNMLKRYKEAVPWKTFKFGKITAKVRIPNKNTEPKST